MLVWKFHELNFDGNHTYGFCRNLLHVALLVSTGICWSTRYKNTGRHTVGPNSSSNFSWNYLLRIKLHLKNCTKKFHQNCPKNCMPLRSACHTYNTNKLSIVFRSQEKEHNVYFCYVSVCVGIGDMREHFVWGVNFAADDTVSIATMQLSFTTGISQPAKLMLLEHFLHYFLAQ